MRALVFSNAAVLRGLVEDIVFVPIGSHEIEPYVIGGDPKVFKIELTCDNGPGIAARMDATLQSRLAGDNVRPIIDFDHDVLLAGKGPAAAIPTKILFDPTRGLVLELDWTGAGRSAVEDRNYSYFSPVVLVDEAETAPFDIPEKGPIGGLVNEPAFRNIPRIAAAHQAAPHLINDPMKNLLVLCGLLSSSDADGTDDDGALQIAKRKLDELAKSSVSGIKKTFSAFAGNLRETIDGDNERERALLIAAGDHRALVTSVLAGTVEPTPDNLAMLGTLAAATLCKLEKLNKDLADSEIKKAIAAGRIAPKDNPTIEFWREQITAIGAPAIAALSAMGKVAPGITTRRVAKGEPNPAGDAVDFQSAADQLIEDDTSGKITMAMAYRQISQTRPELYAAHREGLGPRPPEEKDDE